MNDVCSISSSVNLNVILSVLGYWYIILCRILMEVSSVVVHLKILVYQDNVLLCSIMKLRPS